MQNSSNIKTLIQCDFDGTLTEEDISFLILDAFADGDWRSILEQYKSNRISVGRFNTLAFRMVKQDEPTLVSFVKDKAELRPGLKELINYCSLRNFRFTIVSNGMTFYIKALLKNAGIDDIEIYAAQSEFNNNGIEARYIGPDGREIQNGFKEAYANNFLNEGWRVISIGNGASDIPAAKLAHYTFATEPMLSLCREQGVNCLPFKDLSDIIKGLESID
ncbi:MAG: MtnX-like HAD-IB family phosphatase [Dehalococcoidales bacterium]|jgi:2-hydroxy-3-keto-5-methylthiopentenyl-1-phosphate phosphatase|nr:MtnX-like HAD-IB family phosphatase [Dehalococcoidales bacterium]MDD3994190.1 MtnX-like HAD-IB family phosphatase [Dehalococcoidales bacterium]NLT27626.1 MtnX-like HAD-IB family phosphatase [Dehalococcoidales bacterium]